MVRKTRLVAALAAVSLALAACGGGSSSKATDTGALETISAGKLTVCSDAPYEPFEYQAEDKSWTGFDMDMLHKIAEANNLTLEVTVQPFDGIWLAPAAGKCDMVASSMSITPERQANADFTQSYFDSYQSLLVRNADKDTLTTIESLSGKTIAVQTGTTGEAFAKANVPDAKIKSFDDASAMFLALESNQVDGVLQDFPINAYRAVKQGTSTVSITFDQEGQEPDHYGFSVKKGNTALLDALNKGIDDLKASGDYDAIHAKYFG